MLEGWRAMLARRRWTQAAAVICIGTMLLTLAACFSDTDSDPWAAEGMIMDNTDATVTGPWKTSTVQANYHGDDYLSIMPGTGANTVRWTPKITEAGSYGIYYWLPEGNDEITMNALFKVVDSVGEKRYQINERAGGKWILIGKHHFEAGSSGYIEVDDHPEGGGTIIADAIKMVPEGPQPKRDLKTGYLLDEIFQSFSGYPPSGWNLHSGGGSAKVVHTQDESNIMVINDLSSEDNVTMSKEFLQQSGTIVMEWKYKVESNSTRSGEDISFELRQGTTSALKIKINNGKLVMEHSSGEDTILQEAKSFRWIGMKVVADIKANEADVYIDGVKRAEAAEFRNKVGALDHVAISTGASDTVKLLLSAMKVYKGYHVHETFMTDPARSVPASWNVNSSGGEGSVQKIVNGQKPYDANLFRFSDTSGTEGVALSKTFDKQSGNIQFEYKFMLPEKLDGVTMELGNGTTSAVKIVTSGGSIGYEDSTGQAVSLIHDYKANVWYEMRIVADSSTDMADYIINHVAKATNIAFRNEVDAIDTVRFATPAIGMGYMFLDDIFIFDYMPPSSVPEPQVESPPPGKYVGPQYFAGGFREGSHAAWGSIISTPARKPLLGWYDEGNPEVADWELKWMLEHGMNMVSTLWFRGLNAAGTAPKTSRKELPFNAMLDSKFIDQMNFWIVWENSGNSMTDMNDWNQNLIPYWIEHFFKHPSYLIVDNKPVFGILNNGEMIKQLGSAANVAKALSDFEQAAIAEGFDGVIFVAQYRHTDPGYMQTLKSSGYDYIYAYNWRISGDDTTAIRAQQFHMESQRNANKIGVLPTISVGWDTVTPWWENNLRYRLPPEQYEALARWTKDTFMPSLPADSLGRDLLLLDNWNEYGEGHWIHPSADYGFGHLDAIRSVFTSAAPNHRDLVPEDVGLGPYDLLFPQSWTAQSWLTQDQIPEKWEHFSPDYTLP